MKWTCEHVNILAVKMNVKISQLQDFLIILHILEKADAKNKS